MACIVRCFDHGKTKHFNNIFSLVAINPGGNGFDFRAAFFGKGERKIPGHKGAPCLKDVKNKITEEMGYGG
jgi:hypothetical protein